MNVCEAKGLLLKHSRSTRPGDPFDRMLVAQAIRLDAFVVSLDQQFAPYEVNALVA